LSWDQALIEIGEARAIDFSPVKKNKTLEDEPINLHTWTRSLSLDEVWEFRRIGMAERMVAAGNISAHSFSKIPQPELPNKLDSVIILRRYKGFHLYLMMSWDNHKIYEQMRKHCFEIVSGGKAFFFNRTLASSCSPVNK